MTDFKIRTTTIEDTALILRFIKELAVYEKLEKECIATEALLAENLFGKKKVAEAVIGEYKGEPVGMALFFYNFSTFLAKPGIYLEDIIVSEKHRGKGFGSELIRYLFKRAANEGCGRVEWAVLDWNEPAINFYKNLGAELMDEWTICRLSGEALQKAAE